MRVGPPEARDIVNPLTGADLMNRNKGPASSGRQLPGIAALLATEKSPDVRAALWKRRIRLVLDQGNRGAAEEYIAEALAEQSGLPAVQTAAADGFSRLGKWEEALGAFKRAVELLRGSGEERSARRLELGPVYRLTEAAGNHAGCIELARGSEPLALVLRARAWRRGGARVELPFLGEENGLSSRLLALETAFRDGDTRFLPGLVEEWDRSEPEWRWRVFAEGLMLSRDLGRPLEAWRKLGAELSRSAVLDPRFEVERKAVQALFKSRGSGPRGVSLVN